MAEHTGISWCDATSDPEVLRARGLTEGDIAHVRAFAAFLRLPTDGGGRKVCPPSFYAYATGGDLPPPDEVAAILEPKGTS